MSNARYEAKVEGVIPASIEKVWDAFATSDGFARIYEGIKVESDWKVGGPVVWSGEWEGKAFRDEGVITVYDRPRLFEYTYWTSFWGLPRTPDTTQPIRNEFQAVAGGTKVLITQSNLRSPESRDSAEKNWRGIIAKIAEGLK
ncbi:MAG: SRPBCC domain-containing protein [Treponemataceae bacterium]